MAPNTIMPHIRWAPNIVQEGFGGHRTMIKINHNNTEFAKDFSFYLGSYLSKFNQNLKIIESGVWL